MNDTPYSPIMFYDKISDDIMPLGKNTVMRFNVVLHHNPSGKDPRSFHQEYEYRSAKYNFPIVSIKRVYEYYISIENYKEPKDTEKAFIKITQRDFPLFKSALAACIAWHTDSTYSKLYAKDENGNLYLCPPIPAPIEIKGMQMGKYLKFEPSVMLNVRSCTEEPSVRLKLASDYNWVELSIDVLMAMYDVLSNLNMFAIAQSMVPSISVPLGTNRYNMEDGIMYKPVVKQDIDVSAKIPNISSGIKGRKPNNKTGLDDL